MEISNTDDIRWMRRALQLASYGWGRTSPNPMVGAVIVSADGRVIGEGWHRRYGGPHAEVQAFANVSPKDEHLLPDATIYVTLEPCSHYGKTPPCANLIVGKGVRRCVVACGDPNPKVSGRGIDIIRKAGIEVVTGVLEKESLWLNRRFMTSQTLRRPWILLKWAESADGFIAATNPEYPAKNGATEFVPVALSTPLSAVLMHRERAECDAILVGTNTVIADRPSLNSRLWPGNSPKPVIFSSPRIPEDITFAGRKPIILDPAIPLRENMERLFADHGITSLMVEGGRDTLMRFIEARLFDEIRQEISAVTLHAGLPHPSPFPLS